VSRAAVLAVCLAASLAAVGCGGGSIEISGDLAEGEHADSVLHFGGVARVAVAGDSFRIEGLGGEVVDLRFVDDDGLHARMEIRDAPGGAIHLRGIWMDEGAAYPSGVRMEGGGTVTINGVRMADPEGMPEEIDATGVVLAASGSGDAILVRPDAGELPDLRVVVTHATAVTSPDGDPVEVDRVEPGDSVTVRGRTEAGYLVASEIVLPRRSATRGDRGEPDGDDGDDGGDGDGDGDGGDRSGGEASEEDRSGDRGRGKGRGRGRGRGPGD
jgi:hypothetical protein